MKIIKLFLLGALANALPLVLLLINNPSSPLLWLSIIGWCILSGFVCTAIFGIVVTKVLKRQFETPKGRHRILQQYIIYCAEYNNSLDEDEKTLSALVTVVMSGAANSKVLRLLFKMMTDPKLLSTINNLLEEEHTGSHSMHGEPFEEDNEDNEKNNSKDDIVL